MMTTYARIDDGKVVEIIEPLVLDFPETMPSEDGAEPTTAIVSREVPINERYHPDFVATLVDVSGVPGVEVGWSYDGRTFAAPIPYTEPVAAALARALIDIRVQRAPILNALAGIGYDALVANDAATSAAVSQARNDLKNIAALPALLAAATYDDMKAAVLTEYRRIAANAPAGVQSAFREVFAS
jgi:hypothetical protein